MFSPYYFSRYWLLSSVSLRSLIRSVGIRILIAVTIARLFFIYTFRHLDSLQTDTQSKFDSWLIYNYNPTDRN
jgi:hypothetical protein